MKFFKKGKKGINNMYKTINICLNCLQNKISNYISVFKSLFTKKCETLLSLEIVTRNYVLLYYCKDKCLTWLQVRKVMDT